MLEKAWKSHHFRHTLRSSIRYAIADELERSEISSEGRATQQPPIPVHTCYQIVQMSADLSQATGENTSPRMQARSHTVSKG
jgi:hypothetical protein